MGPGSLLAGRYRFERLLGEGASGRVWLARDTRERGLVWAVKELDFRSVPASERVEAMGLFEREAAILMRLRHPSLPRVEDRLSQEGREYLVMERVEGPTLADILRHRVEAREEALEEALVAAWGVQVCDVLAYLHGLAPPVVYRDLKPANVMVQVNGSVKLVDFGIARRMRPGRPGDTTAYGTPGYAPPEQYQGLAEPRSDLYALGATLFELLSGRDPQPFGFAFPPIRDLNPEVSVAMEGLLAACLQTDPAARPASAREVQGRLQALAERPRNWLHRALARLQYRLLQWGRRTHG